MKRKGFTLIELLAVIVILAVIAIIATPMIMDVIEKSRRGAAIESVNGILDAAEKYQLESMLEGIDYPSTIDLTSDVLSYKGAKPESGTLIIGENGKMSILAKYGKYCIQKNYSDESPKVVEGSICTSEYEVTLKLETNEIAKQVISAKTNTKFTIDNIDLSTITNLSCNGGANPIINGNELIVEDIYENTTCTLSSSLLNAVQTLDSTETTIVVFKDEEISENLIFPENTNVNLNLNSYTINLNGFYLRTYGDLMINGTNNSKILGTSQIINNSGTGTVMVHGGNYERTEGTGATILNAGEGTIYIDNASVVTLATGPAIQNGIAKQESDGSIIITGGTYVSVDDTVSNYTGDITINSGTFTSQNYSAIVNRGTNTIIHISQTNQPIYISSLAQSWNPAIRNMSTGTVYINGTVANNCTQNSNDTTNGLCVYAEGDRNFSNDTSNTAISNTGLNGQIDINGGTYFGGYYGISNHQAGVINVKNAKIESGHYGVANMRNAITNICSSTIIGATYDLYVWLDSKLDTNNVQINYDSNTLFRDNNNIPVILPSVASHITKNDNMMCISERNNTSIEG